MIALVLLAVVLHRELPQISNVTTRSFPIGVIEDLPLLPDHLRRYISKYIYTMDIEYQDGQQTLFRIHSNGCAYKATLNGISMESMLRDRCNNRNSINLNLTGALVPGTNQLEIRTDMGGFNIAPGIFYDLPDSHIEFIALGMIAIAMYVFGSLVTRGTGDRWTGLMASAGLALYLYWFVATGVRQYSQDLGGHLDYISIIALKMKIPRPLACWSCFHPPLYYSIEAGLLWATNFIRGFDPINILRLSNIVLYCSFLFFTLKMLRRLIPPSLAYYMAVALVVCYPSGVFTSARIDSNSMVHAAYAACAYFLVAWLQDGRMKQLAIMLALAGLALATRTNALVLLPLIGLAVIYQLYRRSVNIRTLLRSGMLWLGVLVLVVGATANFGRNIYFKAVTQRSEPLLISNAEHLMRFEAFHIKNSVQAILVPHLRDYVSKPFHPAFNNNPSRDHFWNAMLKTSMFGEYVWPKPDLAKLMSLLLMGIILYVLNSAALSWGTLSSDLRWWICVVPLFTFISFLIALRLVYPVFSSHDFRYIYPAVGCFAGIIGLLTERNIAAKRAILTFGGAILVGAFCLCSVVFFL